MNFYFTFNQSVVCTPTSSGYNVGAPSSIPASVSSSDSIPRWSIAPLTAPLTIRLFKKWLKLEMGCMPVTHCNLSTWPKLSICNVAVSCKGLVSLQDLAAPGLLPSIPQIYPEEKVVEVAEVNQWRCFEDSEQWLDKVERTHQVLAGGKLVLLKKTWLHSKRFDKLLHKTRS